MHEEQSCSRLLLVRPACFGFNVETAGSNAFQHRHAPRPSLLADVRAEFDALVDALTAAGVDCCVLDDEPVPGRPDAIFPNNWVSWHADGTVVLYPMQAPNRRPERRNDVIAKASAHAHFDIRRRLDLAAHEQQGRFLEGTGSLVLDRAHRLAYACRSSRTDEQLVKLWCQAMNFQPVVFDAHDDIERPYYHTNVMLWIGSHCAMICLEAMPEAQRTRVQEALAADHQLIAIDRAGVRSFAGNMLEVRARNGTKKLLISATALAALSADQHRVLSAHYPEFIVASVPTIEQVGGGSVRCMVAELAEVASP
jgi:hypothetical protein